MRGLNFLIVCWLTKVLDFRLNRPSFEQLVQTTLKGSDLSNILEHYNRTPASGFWILDYGDQFVGLIALDAYEEKTTLSTKKSSKQNHSTPSTATIRHFFIDEAYRGSGIQSDLLAHAVQIAFGKDPSLQRITALDSSLITYVRSSLREAGFELDRVTGRIGVYRWKLGQRTLERENWEKKVKTE